MRGVLAIVTAASLALGSCSYEYRLNAALLDGRIAFAPDPATPAKHNCFNAIEVRLTDAGANRREAAPRPGPRDGVVWREAFDNRCRNLFPAVYGMPLKGRRLFGARPVAPQPLSPGSAYVVTTTSGVTGRGVGRFALTPDGRVVNLPGLDAAAVACAAGQAPTGDCDERAAVKSPGRPSQAPPR